MDFILRRGQICQQDWAQCGESREYEGVVCSIYRQGDNRVLNVSTPAWKKQLPTSCFAPSRASLLQMTLTYPGGAN